MLGFILADLRRHLAGVVVVALLIALATALGVAVTLQERALRLGSARAAAPFDLLIGAPGSETQLVLSSVFLQPAPLPLMDARVLKALRSDPRVAWAAPVGFGDFAGGDPIVGTTADIVTGLGSIAEGAMFARLDEVVVGSRVERPIGSRIRPLHGRSQDGGHTHAAIEYHVVGRMAPTGTPWDWAVLVPIETVWAVHEREADAADAGSLKQALSRPHEDGAPRLDAPVDPLAAEGPMARGLPAIVVRPRSIADAYKLRQQYRGERTLAVFPGEVLTRLYGTLGDARTVLAAVAVGAQALVAAAILLVAVVHVLQRRRQIGALRAFGAPRRSVLLIVWSETFLIAGLGIVAGFVLGFVGAKTGADLIAASTRVALPIEFRAEDAGSLLGLLLATGLAALVPALLAYRQAPTQALRS